MIMSKSTLPLISFISLVFCIGTAQVSAKDLANGWSQEDFKKHYLGCVKGAVGTNLKKLVEKGTITKQTTDKDRKAIVAKLVDMYIPVCKCIQSSVVKKVSVKDIKKLRKDKKFTSSITKACVKKHLK